MILTSLVHLIKQEHVYSFITYHLFIYVLHSSNNIQDSLGVVPFLLERFVMVFPTPGWSICLHWLVVLVGHHEPQEIWSKLHHHTPLSQLYIIKWQTVPPFFCRARGYILYIIVGLNTLSTMLPFFFVPFFPNFIIQIGSSHLVDNEKSMRKWSQHYICNDSKGDYNSLYTTYPW